MGSQHDWFRRGLRLHASQFPRQDFTVTQFRQRPALGFRRRRAACQRFFVAVLQMLRQFFNDGGLARRLQLQARQPLSDLLLPPWHVLILRIWSSSQIWFPRPMAAVDALVITHIFHEMWTPISERG